MICIFIQLRCRPGRTYEVADAIYDMEFASELYSTSGEWDLLMKVYVPEGEDVGRFVAAGGPLVHPDLQVLTITPICPFLCDFRPMVLPTDRPLDMMVEEATAEVVLTCDGQATQHPGPRCGAAGITP